ncbi:uncharacterized protein B0I36DRAFT_339854 [Microdochium trichocladiopsis]|uniref:Cyanovirin-N domain-containing protein n=1 Tax=Microdochium trichocladiopsis TaxID=1682393 RepID=A0A9P8XRG0_9PEZI|nr:uncharacterized protein B0I36DRAFT_343134 [Microdochium trichocladiopsis]XP_046004868.1 uncharacterized protein B0I36DRAFT_339854 [Microdochium trichocladiopsis]KAH7007960.1 hypothetical protein B0I36DRAFT_343134 [Microdochium trichocladiopsis]KAH7012603.1 hypothetical protein B0I36DRAFT_339854 [Microdochium trichocladiopsis]
MGHKPFLSLFAFVLSLSKGLCDTYQHNLFELCDGIRVHSTQSPGAFSGSVILGANCHLWPNSSSVAYSYLDLAPCLWNHGGRLAISDSIDECGGYFVNSCENCFLDPKHNTLSCECTSPSGKKMSSVLLSDFLDASAGHLTCSNGAWIGARGPNIKACTNTTMTFNHRRSLFGKLSTL